MTARLCSKAGKHSGRPVEALCLEEGCREDCLLCFYCVFEAHSNHHVAYLHPELEGPFSNLYRQALLNSPPSRERLETTFNNITGGCQQLVRNTLSRLEQIQRMMAPQIESIRCSFSTSSIDQMLSDLTSNQKISADKISKYITILRFYHQHSAFDIERLERSSTMIWNTLNSFLQETTTKIGVIFADLQAIAAGMSLIKDISHATSHVRQPVTILQQKIAENMEILKRESEGEGIGEGIAQDEMIEQKHQEEQVRVQQNHLPLQAGECIDKQAILGESEKKAESVNLLNEEDRASQQSSCLAIDEERVGVEEPQKVIEQFKGKDGSKMVIKNGKSSLQLIQQQWPQDCNWQPKGIVPSKKADRILRKSPMSKVQAVFITAVCPKELNQMLQRVQAGSVKSLLIRCETRLDILDAESVSFIIKMKRLTSLRVFHARNMPEWMAIELLENLRDLEELVLAEFSHLTPRVVDVIKAYNINLTRICFAGDLRSLRTAEEALQFLPDIVEGLRQEDLWLSLTESALLLSALELQNPTNHAYWINYFRNCGHALREVTIIKTESQQLDYTQLLRAIAKFCRNLECLRLEMLQFQEDMLIEVLKNNKDLQVFVVSECRCVTMRTYRTLFKHAINLRALSISLDDKFTAKFASYPKNLEVLILRGCYGIIENDFCGLISTLTHLRCLSVNYADGWLNKNAIWQISKTKSLQVLNISHNPDCLHPFNLKCLKLRTLISNNNAFSYTTFTDHNFTASIEKLSISGVSTQKGKEVLDLDLLRFFFPRLTHLKAVDYERLSCDPNRFDQHKHLASIVVGRFTKTEDIESIRLYCVRRKINFLQIKA